jgi:hypothetical protein
VVLRGALASGAAATRLGSCENGHESPFRHCTDVWKSGQIGLMSSQRPEAASIRFGAQLQAGKIRERRACGGGRCARRNHRSLAEKDAWLILFPSR